MDNDITMGLAVMAILATSVAFLVMKPLVFIILLVLSAVTLLAWDFMLPATVEIQTPSASEAHDAPVTDTVVEAAQMVPKPRVTTVEAVEAASSAVDLSGTPTTTVRWGTPATETLSVAEDLENNHVIQAIKLSDEALHTENFNRRSSLGLRTVDFTDKKQMQMITVKREKWSDPTRVLGSKGAADRNMGRMLFTNAEKALQDVTRAAKLHNHVGSVGRQGFAYG